MVRKNIKTCSRIISCAADLFTLFDIPAGYDGTDWKFVKRYIYKNTECGANINPKYIASGKEQWKAWVLNRLGIPHLLDIASDLRGCCTNMSMLPYQVVDYLDILPPRTRGVTPKIGVAADLTFTRFKDLNEDWEADDNCGGDHCVIIEFETDSFYYGITISSIVEGSDHVVEDYDLIYPFTEDQLWAMVADVEEAVEAYVEYK